MMAVSRSGEMRKIRRTGTVCNEMSGVGQDQVGLVYTDLDEVLATSN